MLNLFRKKATYNNVQWLFATAKVDFDALPQSVQSVLLGALKPEMKVSNFFIDDEMILHIAISDGEYVNPIEIKRIALPMTAIIDVIAAWANREFGPDQDWWLRKYATAHGITRPLYRAC